MEEDQNGDNKDQNMKKDHKCDNKDRTWKNVLAKYLIHLFYLQY